MFTKEIDVGFNNKIKNKIYQIQTFQMQWVNCNEYKKNDSC